MQRSHATIRTQTQAKPKTNTKPNQACPLNAILTKNTPTNIPTKRISPNPAQITETQTKTKPIQPHQPTLSCQSLGRRQHIPSSTDLLVNEQLPFGRPGGRSRSVRRVSSGPAGPCQRDDTIIRCIAWKAGMRRKVVARCGWRVGWGGRLTGPHPDPLPAGEGEGRERDRKPGKLGC
jgi:hypothetical protein